MCRRPARSSAVTRGFLIPELMTSAMYTSPLSCITLGSGLPFVAVSTDTRSALPGSCMLRETDDAESEWAPPGMGGDATSVASPRLGSPDSATIKSKTPPVAGAIHFAATRTHPVFKLTLAAPRSRCREIASLDRPAYRHILHPADRALPTALSCHPGFINSLTGTAPDSSRGRPESLLIASSRRPALAPRAPTPIAADPSKTGSTDPESRTTPTTASDQCRLPFRIC